MRKQACKQVKAVTKISTCCFASWALLSSSRALLSLSNLRSHSCRAKARALLGESHHTKPECSPVVLLFLASTAVPVFFALLPAQRKEVLASLEDRICVPIAIVFVQIVVRLVDAGNEHQGRNLDYGRRPKCEGTRVRLC